MERVERVERVDRVDRSGLTAGRMAPMGGSTADANRGTWTASVLRVLAAVAPELRAVNHDLSGAGPTTMAWLGHYLPAPNPINDPEVTSSTAVGTIPDLPAVAALDSYDALSPGSNDLAIVWLWVAGSATIDGRPTRILRPLASRTVGIERIAGLGRIPARAHARSHLEYHGNWDLWPLVGDPDRAAGLERTVAFGGGALGMDWNQQLVDRLHQLRRWVNEVLEASGLRPVRTLTATGDPRNHQGDDLRVYVGSGLFAVGAPDSIRPRESLTAWSNDGAAATTAFADLYLGPNPAQEGDVAGRPPPPAPGPADIVGPLPLTTAQTRALVAARTEAITVVSGPPGTGKSQTAAAIALDTVARGQSVLVATQSRMAAEVLAGLLDRVPGPTPVLFGGGTRTGALATKLADV